MKINKHIEILRTDVRQFSSMSHTSALKIQKTLRRHYKTVGLSLVNNPADLERLVSLQPDLVFLGLKRIQFEQPQTEVWLTDFLDERQINYTGSQSEAIKLDFDKAQAKDIISQASLHTPQFFTARPDEYSSAQDLPHDFPFFVKPLSTGGGNGIGDDSVVRNFTQFQQKVASIYKSYGSSSLVEQYLEGREFTVAILEQPFGANQLVMPIEIITAKNQNGDRILGSQVKVEDNEQIVGIDEKVIGDAVCKLALDAYALLGGRDIARIDIRMDAQGEANFLEANFVPAPGTRYFAGACLINEQMSYEAVMLHIVDLALSRWAPSPMLIRPTALELAIA